MMSFGERLKDERERLLKTQFEFCALTGVSKGSLIAYEKNTTSPPADFLLLAAAQGVDLNYVFFGVYGDAKTRTPATDLVVLVQQMPPAAQAMGFAVLNLFAKASAKGGVLPHNGEDIWRAARLFGQFLDLSDAGKEMVELALEGARLDPPAP